MGCYPEVVKKAGIIGSGGAINRVLPSLNRPFSARLDHIVCLDKPMKLILTHRNRFHAVPTSIIPNWEPLSHFPRQEFEMHPDAAPDSFTALYSGNLGHGHSLDTLIEAAQRLQQTKTKVRFIVTGGGVGMAELERKITAQKLTSFELLGYVPKDQFRQIQKDADCAIITLRDEMPGIMRPSKLYPNLAMGQPVLYIGPRESNADEAIRQYQCGISLRNNGVDGIDEPHNIMADSPAIQQSYAQRARSAFEDKYCDLKTLPLFDITIDLTNKVLTD